jgi:FMN phosphatase YigB (HAD superfamily)
MVKPLLCGTPETPALSLNFHYNKLHGEIMKQQLQLLLVDFDGVMSEGRFYDSVDEASHKQGKRAVRAIFASENMHILKDWMRGAYTYKDIHDLVEKRTGLQARQLDILLEESVKRMSLNKPLLKYIAGLRAKGIAVSLFTNNMDIFDTVSRAHHHLDNHFDHIYSSSTYGQLKLENSILLERAIAEAGAETASTAFVDDSQTSYDAATRYGVATFLYKHYDTSQPAFEKWLSKAFAW